MLSFEREDEPTKLDSRLFRYLWLGLKHLNAPKDVRKLVMRYTPCCVESHQISNGEMNFQEWLAPSCCFRKHCNVCVLQNWRTCDGCGKGVCGITCGLRRSRVGTWWCSACVTRSIYGCTNGC